MEIATYYALIVASFAVLVTISVQLAGLSKRKSATIALKFFLQAVFVVVLLIIIAASMSLYHTFGNGEEPYIFDEPSVSANNSEEVNFGNTIPPRNTDSESEANKTYPPQVETSEISVQITPPSVSTAPTELEISEQAYSAYCRWEQGKATETDIGSIIAYIDEIVSDDENIDYERIYYTVSDVNNFFYVNADKGFHFSSLDDLAYQIVAKIQSNQIDNHCGNYCITYCQQEGIFVIQLSMEYVN